MISHLTEALEGFMGTWNPLQNYSLSLSGAHVFLLPPSSWTSAGSSCFSPRPSSLCLPTLAFLAHHGWPTAAPAHGGPGPRRLQLPGCRGFQFSSTHSHNSFCFPNESFWRRKLNGWCWVDTYLSIWESWVAYMHISGLRCGGSILFLFLS